MYLVVKLRFGFLFNYFFQHEALCSYFAVTPEIPQTASLQFRPIQQALVCKWRQNFTHEVNNPTVNARASTNKVSIFNLTIEDYFRNYSESIGSKFLLPTPIKSVAFFLGHLACVHTLK